MFIVNGNQYLNVTTDISDQEKNMADKYQKTPSILFGMRI